MNRAHRQKDLKTTITTTKQQQSPGGVSKLEPPTVRTIGVPRQSRSGKNEAGTRGVHAAQRPDFQMARASLAQLGPLYRAMAVLSAPAARIFTLIPVFCLLHIHTHASTQIQTAVRSATQRGAKKHEKTSKNLVLLETRRRLRNINLLLRARLQIKVESASHSTLLRPPHRNGGVDATPGCEI